MKHIILVISLITSIQIFAQNYTPFPEDSVYWIRNVASTGGVNCGDFKDDTYVYFSFNDTIINSTKYNLVKVSKVNVDYNEIDLPITTGIDEIIQNGVTAFFYRNDIPNKKVYKIDYEDFDHKEFLWYDFDLRLGDTINDKASLFAKDFPNQNTVIAIDSTETCNGYKKTYTIGNCLSQNMLITEGEGIGLGIANENPCYLFEPCTSYGTSMHSKECNPNFMESIPPVSLREHSSTISNLTTFPNPVKNHLGIEGSFNNTPFTIYNQLGIIVKSGFVSNNQIEIQNFNSGLYFITIEKGKQHYGSRFIKK